MEQRPLGRTGIAVSAIGFGAGDTSGLMTKGTPAERERGVRRALDLGITFFDTAAFYGHGASERNLGRALRGVTEDVVVATKIGVPPDERSDIGGAVARAVDESLTRLGRDSVDVLQLHPGIWPGPPANALELTDVLEGIAPAFERLKTGGKARAIGFSANGDPRSLRGVVDSGLFDTVQIFLSLLNPSAAFDVPARFPGHDFEQVATAARDAGLGIIAIRVLGGGALSGTRDRHAYATQAPRGLFTSAEYADDLERSERLAREAGLRLPEDAVRFALAVDGVSTAAIGISSVDQVERAAAAAALGPLPADTIRRLREIWKALD